VGANIRLRIGGSKRGVAGPLNGLPIEAKVRLRKKPQPKWIAPMLATLTDERFSREGWLFEPKWDGERCLAFRCGGQLNLFSRNRILLMADIRRSRQRSSNRRPSPSSLTVRSSHSKTGSLALRNFKARMQVASPSAELIRRVPVWFYLFDLLYLDHYDTRDVPLQYRKELLRKTFEFTGCLQFTEHRETEGEAHYRDACHKG
jgi:ATP-dependent DNA ligase